MSSSPRPGEIEPVQPRARRTRDALLAAVEELLREGSFQDATVSEIAARAGVSVGSLYRRFEGKDALVPVLFDLYLERFAAHQEALRADPLPLDAGLREALRAAAERAWAFLVDQAHLLRAVHLYGRLHPELVGEEWTELLETSRRSFRALLEHLRHEVRHDDLDGAAEACAYFFNTVLLDRGLYPEVGPARGMELDGVEFAHTMADFAWAWLTSGAGSPSGFGGVPGRAPAGLS